MQSNLFSLSNLDLPKQFITIFPYSISLHKALLSYIPQSNISNNNLNKSNDSNHTHKDNEFWTPFQSTLNESIFACPIQNATQLWVWGNEKVVLNIIDVYNKDLKVNKNISNENRSKEKESGVKINHSTSAFSEVFSTPPATFTYKIESFQEKLHINYALMALKCYMYFQFSKKYPVFYNFVNVYNNLGFHLNIFYRESKIYLSFDTMEINLEDLGKDTEIQSRINKNNNDLNSQFSLKYKNQKDKSLKLTSLDDDIFPSQLDQNEIVWVLTPLGIPGKVFKMNNEYCIVKIALHNSSCIFKNSQVRKIIYNETTFQSLQNRNVINKKISKLLKLEESSNRSRTDRKRKRINTDNIFTNGSKFIDSDVHTPHRKKSAKKIKSCLDIYDTFSLEDDVRPTSYSPIQSVHSKEIASFVCKVESSPNSYGSTLSSDDTANSYLNQSSIKTPHSSISSYSIPNFSEPQEYQSKILKSYFPEYNGEIPITKNMDVEDSYLEKEFSERDGDIEDDFDALWDEGSNEKSTNENEVEEKKEDDTEHRKKLEQQLHARKQIWEFYEIQSKKSTSYFVQSTNEDPSLYNDYVIRNANRSHPKDEPLVISDYFAYENGSFSSNSSIQTRASTSILENLQYTNVFDIPEVFKSKNKPFNSDNLIFNSESYLPQTPLDTGKDRYCTLQNYIESIHQSSHSSSQNWKSNNKKNYNNIINQNNQESESNYITFESNEPTLLETFYIFSKLFGLTNLTSTVGFANLIKKLQIILKYSSQIDFPNYNNIIYQPEFLPLIGDYLTEQSISIIDPVVHDKNTFEMILIFAFQNSLSFKLPNISADKILSILLSVKKDLGLLLEKDSIVGPLDIDRSFVSITNITFPQIPHFRVGFKDHWLDARLDTLSNWEKLSFQPYSTFKRIRYILLTSNSDSEYNEYINLVLRDISSIFRMCQLGYHLPVGSKRNDIINGVIKLDFSTMKRDSKNSLKNSFVSSYKSKIKETFETLKSNIEIEEDESVIIYILNPIPELLTNTILESIEIPKTEYPVMIHIVDEFSFRSIYNDTPKLILKDFALEIYNKCRIQNNWEKSDFSYFNKLYEPAYILAPKNQKNVYDNLYNFDNPIELTKMTIHFSYKLCSKYILCSWTDTFGQILELRKLPFNSDWKNDAWEITLEFIQQAKQNIAWTFLICKYGSNMEHQELNEWKLVTKLSEQIIQSISIVSFHLDSPLQIIFDSSRLKSEIQKDFKGTIIVVPNSLGIRTMDYLDQRPVNLSECIVFSSMSLNPYDQDFNSNFILENQSFQTFVVTLHSEYHTSGLERNPNEAAKEIGEEMFRLSWLNATPSTPQRKSVLPIHIQLLLQTESILNDYFSKNL